MSWIFSMAAYVGEFHRLEREIGVQVRVSSRHCRRCRCRLRLGNRRKLCSPCQETKEGDAEPVRRTGLKGGPLVTPEIVALFWQRVERNGDESCWGWRGSVNIQGIAVLMFENTTFTARRVSYEVRTGEPPRGILYNRCGNRTCTNPDHLRSRA